jgi:hypothetical protein
MEATAAVLDVDVDVDVDVVIVLDAGAVVALLHTADE